MINTEQFESFMTKYQDMVFSVACRLLGNATDAQDISQAVFLRAFQHFGQLEGNPAAGGWLRTTATNLSLNHLSRYRARWRFFSEMRNDEDDAEYSEQLPAPPSFEEMMPDSDYKQIIESVIQKLPASQRLPLVLYHFEQLSYEEIAKRLRISLSKVKTDIHRGRLALKKYLRPGLLSELHGDAMPQPQDIKQPKQPRSYNPIFARYALRYEPGF